MSETIKKKSVSKNTTNNLVDSKLAQKKIDQKLKSVTVDAAPVKTNISDVNKPGTTNFQVATLTERIVVLSSHLKNNVKDIVARRTLLWCVAKKKKLMKYELSRQKT